MSTPFPETYSSPLCPRQIEDAEGYAQHNQCAEMPSAADLECNRRICPGPEQIGGVTVNFLLGRITFGGRRECGLAVDITSDSQSAKTPETTA